jgi:hypothetical protein
MDGTMADKTAPAMFEETDDTPAGRKSRTVSPDLMNVLAESAKRGKAFARTADPATIDELRKDLSSAAVRAKYDVTTGTALLESGLVRFTFIAKSKVKAPAPAPAVE